MGQSTFIITSHKWQGTDIHRTTNKSPCTQIYTQCRRQHVHVTTHKLPCTQTLQETDKYTHTAAIKTNVHETTCKISCTQNTIASHTHTHTAGDRHAHGTTHKLTYTNKKHYKTDKCSYGNPYIALHTHTNVHGTIQLMLTHKHTVREPRHVHCSTNLIFRSKLL